MVVTEQHVVGAATATTKSITVFVDGVATVLALPGGNVFLTVSDTIKGPLAAGTAYDEYRFFLRDLSEDDEMLCENGENGQYDHLDGTCSLTGNE